MSIKDVLYFERVRFGGGISSLILSRYRFVFFCSLG